MVQRFPVLALECGALKPSDANAMVDIEKTFELWQRQIVTKCNVATAPIFSALLQIARRMTYLTRQHKQDYKKDHELEDIVNWTTGVDEVLDCDEIEVDQVPVDANLVAVIKALQFAMEDRYSIYKLDLTSDAHSARQQSVMKNWLSTSNLAMETALLAAFKPCMALPHVQEFDAVKKNNAAGGFITDEQANTIFLLSSLQLIVHAFGMVGCKKMAETATNSAMWKMPNVHDGLVAPEAKIWPFFDNLSRMNFAEVDSCLQHLQASYLNNFIRIACCAKSLPTEVRDIYDKVADKIRSDGVKDTSVNTLAKTA